MSNIIMYRCRSCNCRTNLYMKIENVREPICGNCLELIRRLLVIAYKRGIARLRYSGRGEYYIDIPSEPEPDYI